MICCSGEFVKHGLHIRDSLGLITRSRLAHTIFIMPEQIGNKKIYSLLEVASSIRRTLSERYGSSFWLKAEMNKLNIYKHSGHCYPDLVQKQDGQVVAQMRSLIWNFDLERINRIFAQHTGEQLHDGISLMMEVSILFDPNYGLSLRIHDIDPSFTLGEIEREKRQCIARLKEEGIFQTNKHLPFPLLPKRIAIISVESSKGYADFRALTGARMKGFVMEHVLFTAMLQGDKAAAQIIAQLDRIRCITHHFDLVAIIRGGGGEVGLSTYNQYELAQAIALFPLPVHTGIGHATNETVCEMVAHTNAITPTELADMLMEQFEGFQEKLRDAAHKVGFALSILREQSLGLTNLHQSLAHTTNSQVNRQKAKLDMLCGALATSVRSRMYNIRQQLSASSYRLKLAIADKLNRNSFALLNRQHAVNMAATGLIERTVTSLDQAEKVVELLNPQRLLEKGYSITLHKGKPVREAGKLKQGDILTTLLAQGSVESQITDTNP